MKLYLALIVLCVISCQDDDDSELFIRYCKGKCQRELHLLRNQTNGHQGFKECEENCIVGLHEIQEEWEKQKEETKQKRESDTKQCVADRCESLKKEGEEEDGRKTPYTRCVENCRKPLPWKKEEPKPTPPTPEPTPTPPTPEPEPQPDPQPTE